MLYINSVYEHPSLGPVLITKGQMYGSSGGISNFWYWRKVKKDGTLGKESSGYGGPWKKIDAEIVTTVRIK